LIEGGPSAAKAALDRIAGALQDAGLRSLGASIPPPTFSFADATFPADGASAGLLLEALERTPAQARERAPTAPIELRLPPGLRAHFGGSPTMRATLEVVARVAPTATTVLIAGETGAGKEVIADLIQLNSDRAGRPYLKINCAAVPETLLETELFGHERGAFTGADRQRIGVFEAAHKGTLFLDEIGDLSPAMQVKLLRVLQERTLTRVGGLKPLEVDVRILAATHQDLGDAVRRGRLREDLYYRLNVIEIRVPPLRERREEIPQLIEHFRLECCRAHALDVKGFAPDAVDALHGYPWPGNVRELRNVVERAMLLADGTTVERRHLQLPGHGPQRGPQGPPVQGLTPRQERILRLAHERQGITNGAVVRAEEVSARTALRELQMLVERGHLVRVGRRRGAVYRPAE
ncbi:MAG: sigma 54-interacting transcriptional regulator, partial [Planctomycetota bacterium]